MDSAKPPNVIVFISHDTGRFIGPYGIETVHTPNADRLAQEGVIFDNYFCTAPQCSPSRAATFTGRYPHANGVMGLTHGRFAWDLSRSETHAAQHFKGLGYETAAIGIAHEMRTNEGRGFDTMVREVLASKVPGEMDAWLSKRQAPDRPFYLQIGTIETHRGYLRDGVEPDDSLGVTVLPHLKETEASRADFAALQGSVRRWDEALGAILRILDERGLAENTLLVVTTDHGVAVPRSKVSLYDPGLGIMLLMRWPAGGFAGGKRYDQLLSNVDLLPTLLESVGSAPTASMQGHSFAPLLLGGEYRERERIHGEMTFHTFYDPQRCVRTRDYKYIRYFEMSKQLHTNWDETYLPDSLAIEETEVSQAMRGHHPYEQLYDLRSDPLEERNVAGDPAYAEVREELCRALADWMHLSGDPLLQGPVPSPFYRQTIEDLGGPHTLYGQRDA
jgi:arylsulfatase A-like enzyme